MLSAAAEQVFALLKFLLTAHITGKQQANNRIEGSIYVDTCQQQGHIVNVQHRVEIRKHDTRYGVVQMLFLIGKGMLSFNPFDLTLMKLRLTLTLLVVVYR